MKSRLIAIAGLVAAITLSAGSAVAAESIKPPDAKQIQQVVQAHLKALADDDATQAFALATTETQQEVGTPEHFMQVIKKAYSPIYHNRRAILDKPETVDGQTIQTASVTDESNRVWVAMFRMERDAANGGWKIGGCALIETESVAV